METTKLIPSQQPIQDVRQEALELIQQMRKLANQAVPPTSAADSAQSFSSVFQDALKSVNSTQQSAEALKTAYESGDSKLSLTDVILASEKSNLAFQFLLSVRNKAVAAYKDIMNIQI